MPLRKPEVRDGVAYCRHDSKYLNSCLINGLALFLELILIRNLQLSVC